jgi:hypothetical protein
MARGKLLALLGLAALTGCAGPNCLSGPRPGYAQPGPSVVLQRGYVGRQLWQLVADEQGGLLGLNLDGSSQNNSYGGSLGFCAGPAAGFWFGSAGPGSSQFIFGPAPASAAYAVLTARGHASVNVPTRPLPQKDGLPSGRFFIVEVPGPDSSIWNVTLTDADGHTVPFANF